MPDLLYKRHLPDWMHEASPSVVAPEPWWHAPVRTLAGLLGVDDPQAATLALLTSMEVPDYRGLHVSPGPRSGDPAHGVTSTIYPDDFYGPNGVRYYGTGAPEIDGKSIRLVQSLRGQPDADVTIYRAVPSHIKDASINPGDWVTVSKQYAIDHGERTLGGDYRIVSKRVKAKEIYTNGDSIHEWGYHPHTLADTLR